MMKWTTIVIVVCLSAQPCLGAVINVPVDQLTIQAAIDSASFGDSIYVSSGTYLEAIVIDESVILKGESKETTVIDGGWAQYVVLITVDSVTFTDFTVKHGSTCLYIATCNNTISDNIIIDASWNGIWGGGDNNVHVGNTISGCTRGILFGSGSGNTVSQNSCSANSYGIIVHGRTNDDISRNELFGNYIGLVIALLSERCVISANNIHDNDRGIVLSQDVDRSEFKRNVIRDNSSYGIYVDLYGGWRSDSNFFYHNIFVNNPVNAYDECINIWDKEYPTGGNYWHDYIGIDDDGDGIGDTPYDIPGAYNQDRYPLMEPTASFCGDPDCSGDVDIDDVVYLINYIFSGGPGPLPYESGDADCSGEVDINDVVWLISYIFSGGYAPCDTDGDEVPDC